MTSEQKALMREVFAGPIVDHYGQTERVAMAGNCPQGGYHIFPDYGIVELLPVPGTTDRWEIVGTPIHNLGFVLFRYRTGDLVGPPEDSPCACGRSFPLLGAVDGRVEDMFTTTDGRVLPLPSSVVDDIPGVRERQIAQLAPGHFEARVVPAAGFDLDEVETRVRHNADRFLGPGQHLRVAVVDHIPRTAGGKFKAAVVELTEDRVQSS
jgi:phenylacetate-CoA ligase